MSKRTDFYTHKAALKEQGKTIEPQWEQLEDQLLKEELLPELIEQLNICPNWVSKSFGMMML